MVRLRETIHKADRISLPPRPEDPASLFAGMNTVQRHPPKDRIEVAGAQSQSGLARVTLLPGRTSTIANRQTGGNLRNREHRYPCCNRQSPRQSHGPANDTEPIRNLSHGSGTRTGHAGRCGRTPEPASRLPDQPDRDSRIGLLRHDRVPDTLLNVFSVPEGWRIAVTKAAYPFRELHATADRTMDVAIEAAKLWVNRAKLRYPTRR